MEVTKGQEREKREKGRSLQNYSFSSKHLTQEKTETLHPVLKNSESVDHCL